MIITFPGWLWFCQKDPIWPEDLDLLWHPWVRGPRNHTQQGPQLQRGLLGPRHPGVWTSNWQVGARAQVMVFADGHRKDYWSVSLEPHSPPFSGSDQMMTYTFILKGIEKMDFPKKITRRPEDLIRKLCRWAGWVMVNIVILSVWRL